MSILKDKYSYTDLYNIALDRKLVLLEELEKVQQDLFIYDNLAHLKKFHELDVRDLSLEQAAMLKKAYDPKKEKIIFEGRSYPADYIGSAILYLEITHIL